MTLETPKMLVLSTAHIARETALRFAQWPWSLPLFYQKGEYGWIIPIVDIDSETIQFRWRSDLLSIRQLAEANDCTWIMLDRDAEVVDGLPVYEW